MSKGYDALKEDRYNVAVEEFRAALALDPKLMLRARFPLAVALFEMHKNDDARRELEAVRQEVGDHPNIMYYLGRVDLEDHQFEQAIGHFTKAAAKPPFPDTAYYLGFAYFKHGDLAAAEEWLKKAEVATPHDSRVPYQLGFVYRQKGEQQESAKAFAVASQLRQRDADEARIQGECVQKLQQGAGEEAYALCNQLYDDNDAERLTELGTLYGQHGDFEAALKPLRRAAELAPQSPQMQFNLAMVYFQLNRFEEARAPLRSALQRWPDLFQLNALYGAVLLKQGEELSAYQALQHAHELNPSDSGTVDLLYTAAIALGNASRASRHYGDSLHYYGEAAKWRPAEPAPHHAMAKIYALTGKPSQAKAEEEVAERLAKN
ncbi:MAG TPA: tetratricopeptide repeat protein, partial [Terriglobales bacterium]|nr:tetratricopeptide repeat protein [Terriglobales bacterium]